MPKFMVEHTVTLARPQSEDGRFPATTVHIKTLSFISAENQEAVYDKVMQYRYPGFQARVEKVTEVGDQISTKELFQDFEYTKVIQEDQI